MPRKNRPLRASFVVTFAATVGCAEERGYAPNPPPPQPKPEVVHGNPPPPDPNIVVDISVEDRACVEHAQRIEGGRYVDVRPPRKVDCPPERVFKREDGQCYFSAPDPCQHSGCNPPPPQPVECPPGK